MSSKEIGVGGIGGPAGAAAVALGQRVTPRIMLTKLFESISANADGPMSPSLTPPSTKHGPMSVSCPGTMTEDAKLTLSETCHSLT